LQFGASSLLYYDGSSFAGFQDVVIVTINYRTNLFGFSGAPDFPVGEQNSGFLDQRLALQWVQDNIAEFGGDPTRVTIFGESAGGVSVKQLMAQPPSPLPFRAAIMESEQAVLPGTALASYKETLAEFGCTDAPSPIECLRGISATDLKTYVSQNDLFFEPVNDHVTFTTDVRPNILSGQFANVPFFMGTNADEGRVFAAAAGFDNSTATIEEVVALLIPNNEAVQQAVTAFYTPFFTDVFLFASAVLTDLGFTCTTSSLSTFAAANGYEVWRYYYDAVFPDLSAFPNAGAFHTSEIPQVFGTYPLSNQFGNATPQQEALSQYMQTTWANFAKNPSAGPGWPRLGSTFGDSLAKLGGSENPSGMTLISLSSVDYVCFLYDPIIALLGY
jgi:carboxylesterase 2